MISVIDLKMLSSDVLRKVKKMTEEELEFREEVGREIERRKQENVNGS